jgi:hypothetical protein
VHSKVSYVLDTEDVLVAAHARAPGASQYDVAAKRKFDAWLDTQLHQGMNNATAAAAVAAVMGASAGGDAMVS